MILESWNELNVQGAFRLGHADFHAALVGRLAVLDTNAGLAMGRLTKELLDTSRYEWDKTGS